MSGGRDREAEAAERLDPAAAAKLPPPGLDEVRGWKGFSVEDVDGAGVARVSGCYVDARSGTPAWLIVKLGPFGGEVSVPMHDCATVAGKVWIPYDRDVLRDAPAVDPTRPLNREQELVICEHFGLSRSSGRAREIDARPEREITARPPG